MNETLLVKLIANSAQCGDMATVGILTDMLNDLRNPVEEKKRKSPDRSGIVQVDVETGKEIARFGTIKEANLAIGKKEKASGISDALNRSNTHVAYSYRWYHVSEWEEMNK